MKELVLVVDDEAGILSTVSSILSDEGYRVLVTPSGLEALEIYARERPDVVLLDIWLPDRDGLEVLGALREQDPTASVVMMSGHGDVSTAVRSVKMGARDYLEKPLSYDRVVQVVLGALEAKRGPSNSAGAPEIDRQVGSSALSFVRAPEFPLVREGNEPQRTIGRSQVLYGLGLHSGARTGMVLQPLPVDSGIHFLSLPAGKPIPAHLSSTTDTEYATTLGRDGETVKTVEHLLSALHARGITNLLIKVHGEVPVLDGSALEFCRHLEEIGVEEQGAPRREVVIDRRYAIEKGDKSLVVEPAERLTVSYELSYPPPIGDQKLEFELGSFEAFTAEIAPARTFGFLKDVRMMNELGLGAGGRLDNFILVGEDEVVNTKLRFPDEFVRHKILDIIGDLYLLGYPFRGRVVARRTGHRDNIAIQRRILAGEG
jgi:UDP-3-O-acyl N-acetylglucosamine deacetylase